MKGQCSAAASSEAPSSSPASRPRVSARPGWGMPTSRSGVQLLHKAEAVELIQELGLPFSPAWSVDELKQIIKEDLFPKDESDAQKALKGISSMKKSELIQKAQDVGAHLTPGMTKPSITLSIRKAVLQKTKPEPTDYMGFGMHGAKTYHQVLDQHPSYAVWAQKEANAESSWELNRFVSWLNEAQVIKTEEQMTKGLKAPVEPVQARGGARSSRRRTSDVLMEDALEEEAKQAARQEEQTANRQVQEQMLTALGQLNQRLERLEAPRAPSSADGSFVAVPISPQESSQGGQAGA